jgi:predicted AAA+ superfamily ATPase
VKSPKVYWRDSGLLHALLNVQDAKQLLVQPWVGASWEGFVLEQALCVLQQCDCPFQAYFFRTSDQHELDLVLDFGRCRWAVEVKLTAHPQSQDMERLNRAADLVQAEKRILVSQTRETAAAATQVSCNLPWLVQHLQETFG